VVGYDPAWCSCTGIEAWERAYGCLLLDGHFVEADFPSAVGRDLDPCLSAGTAHGVRYVAALKSGTNMNIPTSRMSHDHLPVHDEHISKKHEFTPGREAAQTTPALHRTMRPPQTALPRLAPQHGAYRSPDTPIPKHLAFGLKVPAISAFCGRQGQTGCMGESWARPLPQTCVSRGRCLADHGGRARCRNAGLPAAPAHRLQHLAAVMMKHRPRPQGSPLPRTPLPRSEPHRPSPH